MKIIRGFRYSTPDAQGYPDKLRIYNGNTGNLEIYRCDRFRTNPNPYQPPKDSPTGKQRTWQEAYAQIAPTGPQGIPWTCVQTPKHGVCIALNDEGQVQTTLPDPNNDMKPYALAVLIHCGFSPTWPGSKACQTVHPVDWQIFIGHFFLGDKGVYILSDETGGDPEETIIREA
jgi:hypothetical protein